MKDGPTGTIQYNTPIFQRGYNRFTRDCKGALWTVMIRWLLNWPRYDLVTAAVKNHKLPTAHLFLYVYSQFLSNAINHYYNWWEPISVKCSYRDLSNSGSAFSISDLFGEVSFIYWIFSWPRKYYCGVYFSTSLLGHNIQTRLLKVADFPEKDRIVYENDRWLDILTLSSGLSRVVRLPKQVIV